MKKIVIAILTLFFLLAALDGILKTPWAKEKALSFLTESIQDSDWKIKVGTVENAFPNIYVKDVTIENDTIAIYFGSIHANLSLIRLFSAQVFLSDVQADQVSWEIKQLAPKKEKEKKSSSFTLNIHDFAFTNATLFSKFYANLEGSFLLKNRKRSGLKIESKGKIHPLSQNNFLGKEWNFSLEGHDVNKVFSLQKIHLLNDHINITGTVDFDAQSDFRQASIQLKSDTLFFQNPVSSKVRLLSQIDIQNLSESLSISASWRLPTLKINNHSFTDTNGNLHTLYNQGSFTGDISFTTDFLGASWEGKTPFSWEKEAPLSFSDIHIQSPLLKSSGNLSVGPNENLKGSISFTADQIHTLTPPLYGKAAGKITFIDENQIQFDCNLSNFYYESIFAEDISIHSDLILPFENLRGTILCDIQRGEWKSLKLDSAMIETTKVGENWPFQITTSGSLKHPLEATLNGYWSYQPKNLVISLQDSNGSFFKHPFFLNAPSQFRWTPDVLQLKNFSLHLADSNIDLLVNREKDEFQAKLEIQKLPMDVLSINPLDVDITGTFDMDLNIKESKDKMKGNFQAKINDLQMHLLGQTDPMLADGNFSGNFDRDYLSLIGSLKVQETSLFQLNSKLPIHLEVWPPKADLIYDKNANIKVYLKGRIEEFLDFVNLGTHRVEGDLLCDLSVSNTLANPLAYGKCDLTNGYYQNYYTGTELQNMTADFKAKGDTFSLRSFTAQDSQDKGSFSAKGEIKLLPLQKFPFQFDLKFDRFNIATFDLMTSEASGSIQIQGDLEEGLAKGHLEIIESDISIPSRIPKSLPELQVVYKNAEKPLEIPDLSKKTPYPLHLNLTVDAPDGIFLSGRGLDSEWKGKFLVQGTQTDVAAQGKIELIKGKFVFSGREFKLTEGSLLFSGEKNEMPYLNLGATIEIKDVSITAHLTGPLNNPQVILTSSPPLPMGTIMAYLLFGQDLTEINSFQALQLANSIANLAGEGPGILEQTRKSIGVDRIQIITVPSSSAEGGETIAVQVGKYVTEGVLVSFSQGAEDDSSNISIEVEGKGGLSFLLESDQAQEQGKFTIRWSHTY